MQPKPGLFYQQAVEARNLGRLSIDLSQMLSNIQPQDGWHRHRLRSERMEKHAQRIALPRGRAARLT